MTATRASPTSLKWPAVHSYIKLRAVALWTTKIGQTTSLMEAHPGARTTAHGDCHPLKIAILDWWVRIEHFEVSDATAPPLK